MSLRENLLKICKTVRNEEPIMRPRERQRNRVTHGETVRVERSSISYKLVKTWINFFSE